MVSIHATELAVLRRIAGATGLLSELIHRETDECIEWPLGLAPNGYGKISTLAPSRYAHRAALAMIFGPDHIKGKVVMHACDNKPCVNPRHLRAGSQAENVRDAYARGLMENVRPPLIRGEQHGATRLTEADVRAIREDDRAQWKIGMDYGISQTSVSLIKRRKTWAHVE